MCQGAIFTFQISTFDKSRFSHALIIAWKSHHSPYPTVLLPPYDLHIKTNTDKKTEHSQLNCSIPELSKDNNNRLVLQKDTRH